LQLLCFVAVHGRLSLIQTNPSRFPRDQSHSARSNPHGTFLDKISTSPLLDPGRLSLEVIVDQPIPESTPSLGSIPFERKKPRTSVRRVLDEQRDIANRFLQESVQVTVNAKMERATQWLSIQRMNRNESSMLRGLLNRLKLICESS
jgi:hypothetical protein